MDVTALLVANEATVGPDQLLYLEGAAYAWLPVPEIPRSVDVSVSFVVHADPDEHRESLSFRLWVADSDRQPVPESAREALVSWILPKELLPGQPLTMPVASKVSFTAERIGRYYVVVDVDGIDEQHATPFAVVKANLAGT